MKGIPVIAFHFPKDTFLHRLHPAVKTPVLLACVALVLLSSRPITVLCLSIMLVSVTFFVGLPLRQWIIVLPSMLLLILVSLLMPAAAVWTRLIVAWGKVVCLVMIFGLFCMTTKTNDILPLGRPPGVIAQVAYPIAFILNMTLAALPSMQYDLQRASDAETVRRGSRPTWFSASSWTTVLTVVLVRSVTRAERVASTVIDRGYSPSKGLAPLQRRPMALGDVAVGIASVVLAAFIVSLTR